MEVTAWIQEFQALHERKKQAPLSQAEQARWRELKALIAQQQADAHSPRKAQDKPS